MEFSHNLELNSYICITGSIRRNAGCSVGHSCALRSSVTVPEFKKKAIVIYFYVIVPLFNTSVNHTCTMTILRTLCFAERRLAPLILAPCHPSNYENMRIALAVVIIIIFLEP